MNLTRILKNSGNSSVVIIGRAKRPYIRARSILVTGVLVTPLVVSDEEVVINGSGKIGVLASKTCVLISGRKPIIIDKAHCINLVALGTKSPVTIKHLKAISIFAKRVLIGELETREAVFAELCGVKQLLRASRVVFSDPHVYIEEIRDLGEVTYNYKLLNYT